MPFLLKRMPSRCSSWDGRLSANSMTVTYALTRIEVASNFVRSLTVSRRFALKIFGMTILLGFFVFLEFFRRTSSVGSTWTSDIGFIFLVAIGCFPLLPVMAYLTAKTSQRTLIVSADGVFTEIASRQQQTPWSKFEFVQDTDRFFLLVRKNGNAYFIPNRAFNGPEERDRFSSSIRSWLAAPQSR